MCKWGTSEVLEITVPAHLSHTGKKRLKKIGVDKCIAPIVRALNDAGITTDASCCGHNNGPGSIVLADGRELLICENISFARKLCLHLPDIHGKYIEKREYEHFDGKDWHYFVG